MSDLRFCSLSDESHRGLQLANLRWPFIQRKAAHSEPEASLISQSDMFGVLNLNKPEGATSRQIVNVVKRHVHPVKLGHAGTLDPMATGVLPVCLGQATKLIPLLQKSAKVYEAQFTLGQTSDTDDATGEVCEVVGAAPQGHSAVEAALQQFVGEIAQVPPVYSAVRVNGQRAYAKARRGEGVELKPKKVRVYGIELLEFSWPILTVSITCGSGTYIRSIARDLGERLGCGGLMSSLIRSSSSGLALVDSLDPNVLTAENLAEHIVNPVGLVRQHLNVIRYCSATDQLLVGQGRPLSHAGDAEEGASVGFLSADGAELLATGEVKRGHLQPRNVFRVGQVST